MFQVDLNTSNGGGVVDYEGILAPSLQLRPVMQLMMSMGLNHMCCCSCLTMRDRMILLQACLPVGKFRNAPIFHRFVIVVKGQH